MDNVARTLARQRRQAYAHPSPDGGMPEHWHHVSRRGMGGRSGESLITLDTIGVSALLHHRIHAEGDRVLDEMPERPSFEELFL